MAVAGLRRESAIRSAGSDSINGSALFPPADDCVGTARPPGLCGVGPIRRRAGRGSAARRTGVSGRVRERIHTDDFLLDQYTFTEKQTERRLDANGNVKKVTSAAYEVYPSAEPGHTYRKLVEQDGKPLPADELAKEDRKQQAKEAKAAARSPEVQAERRSKEDEAIDELFRLYDIRFLGREPLEGRDAILVTFAPRPGVETTTKPGKILKKFSGRAWIDEEDRQLVRAEAELTDDLSFGFGILAKLKKGARAQLRRRKVNDEIWLPAEARFVGHARLFLVKGLHIDALSEYSDYKKFSVATDATAPGAFEATLVPSAGPPGQKEGEDCSPLRDRIENRAP